MTNLETRLTARKIIDVIINNSPFFGLYRFADKRRGIIDLGNKSEKHEYIKQLLITGFSSIGLITAFGYGITELIEYFK